MLRSFPQVHWRKCHFPPQSSLLAAGQHLTEILKPCSRTWTPKWVWQRGLPFRAVSHWMVELWLVSVFLELSELSVFLSGLSFPSSNREKVDYVSEKLCAVSSKIRMKLLSFLSQLLNCLSNVLSFTSRYWLKLQRASGSKIWDFKEILWSQSIKEVMLAKLLSHHMASVDS